MTIQRHFLNWTAPLLPQAVEYLWGCGESVEHRGESAATRPDGRAARWDLRHLLVVVPAASAGRGLRQLLAERAAEEGVLLEPPEITTVGGLPEQLYRAKLPFASVSTQELAWRSALRDMSASDLAEVIPHAPDAEQHEFWLEISRLLNQLARELAHDGLRFADVLQWGTQDERQNASRRSASRRSASRRSASRRSASRRSASRRSAGDDGEAGSAPAAADAARWRVLTVLQRRYLDHLDQLEQWDRQTARLVAIERGDKELRTGLQIVLVGCVDLSQAMRQMLDRVQARIDALVFADTSAEEGFDEHGCLIPAWWLERPIEIPEQAITVADKPLDQASWLLHTLADWQRDGIPAAAISVGLADAGLAGPVQRRGDAVGQPAHWSGGQPLRESLPYRFLESVADYLQRRWFSAFAALVRHPDVKDWVNQCHDDPLWLGQLDRFQNERLPLEFHRGFFAGPQTVEAAGNVEPQTLQLLETIEELLGELLDDTLSWSGCWEAIRRVLARLYGHQVVDRQTPAGFVAYAGLRHFSTALDELAAVPPRLTYELAPHEAVRLLLKRVAGESLAWPSAPEELPLHGWLDMPWIESTHAVVLGFNEGIVPAAEPADLFLPDQLRARLGLLDNQRRYARDAYALTLLQHSRRELQIIVGRRDADQNPLAPSRLLFAVPPEEIGPRAQRLFQTPPPAPQLPTQQPAALQPSTQQQPATQQLATQQLATRAVPSSGGEVPEGGSVGHAFRLPRPTEDAPVLTELSVTRFGDYLACPYRFYLNYILKLQAMDDQAEELEGSVFGTLMHRLLDRFGKSSLATSTQAKEIESFLHQQLDRETQGWLSGHSLPTVPVQLAQLKARLSGFARRQAERAAEGWRIWMTEVRQLSAEFEVDGEAFRITGQIDRIDVHEATGNFALLDYKSSESGQSPEKLHRERGEWVNLQLPLYRHLARELEELDGELELGYFVLPKEIDHVDVLPAPWSEGELLVADEVARDVIRGLRRREFWPPAEKNSRWVDPLDALCQVGVMERDSEASEIDSQVATNV